MLKSKETIQVQAESSLTNYYSGKWRQLGKWLLCGIIKGKYFSCRELYFTLGKSKRFMFWEKVGKKRI